MNWKAIGSGLLTLAGIAGSLAGVVPPKWGAVLAAIGSVGQAFTNPVHKPDA